jgi:hypothetical protein
MSKNEISGKHVTQRGRIHFTTIDQVTNKPRLNKVVPEYRPIASRYIAGT